MHIRSFLSGICLLVFLSVPASFGAETRTPLLQEGKKTLFQRVVTHPGAILRVGPDPKDGTIQVNLTPFSVFYVFDKKNGFLEVGPSSTTPAGWIEALQATEWPQAMTLLLTERTGRNPVLFFKDQEGLAAVCESDNLKKRLAELEGMVLSSRQGQMPAENMPVLAAEPSDNEGAISRKRFYLMPITQMTDPFEGTKFLQVTSIDPGTEASGGGKNADAEKTGNNAQDDEKTGTMRTGIAFIIDTTISMKPYIEQSLSVIRSAFDNIEKEKLGDTVGFAVIAFRNNTAPNAAVGYTTLKVSDFTTLRDREKLENALSRVEEATASTHSYDEDSLAGVKAAVDALAWENYHSRVLVLISDAGPLPPGDALASTRMGPAEMLDYAKSRNIWITAVHIKSPVGKKDHAYAEKAYRDLTRTASGASSYMPISAPEPKTGAANFATTAKALAESLTRVVQATSERKAPEPPKATGKDKPVSPEEEARRIGETLGYAMRLEFLGQQRGNRAPSVQHAWIADMDLAQLAEGQYMPAVEVAVLLSKNQLSDLQRTLQIIVDQAERTKKTDSRDFFQSILSASAQLARDPTGFSAKPGQNLRQTDVLGEFLDGLPYKSDVMLLTEEDWYRMSVGEQTAFVNRLKSRITRYEEYDKDRSNWESFGAPNAGDWVYRVPLGLLP